MAEILMLALPLASSIFLILRRSSRPGKWLLSAGIVAACCYLLLMLSVHTKEIFLKNKLAEFDLDGNGVFTSAEITPQIEQAMKDVTNDTGRTLAPISGLITCPLYSGFWHLVIGVPYFLICHHRHKKLAEEK